LAVAMRVPGVKQTELRKTSVPLPPSEAVRTFQVVPPVMPERLRVEPSDRTTEPLVPVPLSPLLTVTPAWFERSIKLVGVEVALTSGQQCCR
jgi:hypothetical protein